LAAWETLLQYIETREVEGSRRAAHSSHTDAQKTCLRGASFHIDQHGKPCSIYRNQGRWKEAEELHVKVMQMCKNILERSILNMISMGNLASTYRNQKVEGGRRAGGSSHADGTKKILGEGAS